MKFRIHLLDGIILAALFGTVALVVWSMPEHGPEQVQTVPELAEGLGR